MTLTSLLYRIMCDHVTYRRLLPMSSVAFVPYISNWSRFLSFQRFYTDTLMSRVSLTYTGTFYVIIMLFFLCKSSFLITLCFGPFRDHSFTRRLRTCAASKPFPDWLTESVVVSRSTGAAEQSFLWLSAGAVRLPFNNIPSIIWLFSPPCFPTMELFSRYLDRSNSVR